VKTLFVDNDEEFITQVQDLLRDKAQQGVLPCTPEDLFYADSMEAAENTLQHNDIDLVFLDIAMEHTRSGYSLVPLMKERGTDFLVLSGVIDAVARAEAERQGAIAFLEKPFEFPRVADVIRIYDRLKRVKRSDKTRERRAALFVTFLFMVVAVVLRLCTDNPFAFVFSLVLWVFVFGVVQHWWGQRVVELFIRLIDWGKLAVGRKKD